MSIQRVLAAGMVALAGLAGCDTPRPQPTTQSVQVVLPLGVQGTVGEFASLVGADPMVVRGYGVVVGLGDTGSSELPPNLRDYLIQQMKRDRVGSPMAGTGNLSPARMLEDKDTAVVAVTGRIPPGAPVGTRFDLDVQALAQTQTTSLAGGALMSTELSLSLTTDAASLGGAKTWAVARGTLFVNPFLDSGSLSRSGRLRAGRVLNGGLVSRERPVRLELRRADYLVANLIQRRLNQRFGEQEKVAVAKAPGMIELRVPSAWREDYEHFLRLVMHVYIRGGPEADERYARELARAVLLPTARCEDMALAWEAMGRQVLPILQPLYASGSPPAAYFAARTGLRLQDVLAVEPMVHIALQAQSPFQLAAVEEMGRARSFVQVIPPLKRLLSSPNEMLRVAAYEALLAHGAASAVHREDIAGQFYLDIVQSDRDYTVYATRTGQPKVVLFGQNIPVRRPVFFCPDDELVIINAAADDEKLLVDRKMPRTGRRSDTLQVAPQAAELVRMLGQLPAMNAQGEVAGLGLTYSQVVGVLYGLCGKEYVPAKFVLQRSPEIQRIYSSTPAAGRPDLPEEPGQ